jgi:O-antigen/teichoic acid export membrane protein
VNAAKRGSAASATMIVYGTSLIVAVLSLMNVLIVSRVLGPAGRGGVAFLTAVSWITSSLASGGVEEANANLGATIPEQRKSLATNSVILACLLGGLAMGFVLLLVDLVPPAGGGESSGLLWLAIGSLPILILNLYLRWLVRADYAFGITNIALLITPIANVTINALLAFLGLLSVGTAFATWVAGQTASTVLLAWYVARRQGGFGRPDIRLMRRALGFGLKTQVGRVMLLGNFRLDQWLLGAMAGARELGLYSVAVAWSEALWYLPTAVKFVQRPYLVRSGRQDAARQTAAGFRAATLATAVMGAVMVAAAPFLCETIFGPRFHGSVLMLRILVPGAFGVLALTVFGNALVAKNRPVLSSIALGGGFAFTIVLDVILIPAHGGVGAALASTTAYTAAGVVMGIFFKRALEARTRDLIPTTRDLRWALARSRGLLRLTRWSGRAPGPGDEAQATTR